MSIVERNQDQIRGVIACFDRVIIQGILPYLCYADGMTSWLRRHEVRIFDYARYTEPLRDQIRENAERLANEHGVQIEFVSSSKVRKESLVKEVLDRRGDHPGLVHILSAMESCPSYRPWHDKNTHKTFLKFRTGSCLHYYFYFVDPELGLCYIRVPTWCPFRLQIYFNGHNVLARRLDQAGIAYRLIDNAFVDVEDFEAAQRLADDLDIDKLHRILDDYAALCCPVIETLELRYHWSLMQIEYATDIVFRRQRDLAPLYESIVRTAVHAVKAANVATFLGRKLVGQYRDELGNNFDTRIMGTRIKHHFISGLQDPTVGVKKLRKVVEPAVSSGRRYKGFNFFRAGDIRLFELIAAGEHNVSGFRNRDIRRGLPDHSAGQVSRILKRLRVHGLIKRVGRTYKYYLTRLGRQVILTGLKLRELVVIPELAHLSP